MTLAAATAIGLFAGATLAAFTNLPGAAAEPTTSSTTPTPSTTSTKSPSTTGTSTPTSTGSGAATYPADDNGYIDSEARCDDGQMPVAFGRTSRALVAVCVDREGQLEYRGVRLSDDASVSMPAGRASDGAIVATNDGVTYAVSSTMLLVSEGDTVIYRDAWIEYREPRFSPSTTSSSPTSAAPTSTVTTTTVTVTPSSQEDR